MTWWMIHSTPSRQIECCLLAADSRSVLEAHIAIVSIRRTQRRTAATSHQLLATSLPEYADADTISRAMM